AIAERVEGGAAHVLEHGQPREDVGDLEAAREPHAVDLERLQAADLPAVQVDAAAGEREAPRDQVEQGRLSGAVGADDGVAFARRNGQVDAPDDLGLAEILVDSDELERVHRAPPAPACFRRFSICWLTAFHAAMKSRRTFAKSQPPTTRRTTATTQGIGDAASNSIPNSLTDVPTPSDRVRP